jgi:hypothetical protein
MHLFLHQTNSTGTNMNIEQRISIYHTLTSSQVCQYPKLIQLVYDPPIITENYIFFKYVELLCDIFQTEGASYELVNSKH